MTEYSAKVTAGLEKLGVTPGGAAWVIKALDPVRTAPCRMPDATQVSALTPEYRSSLVIGPPGNVGSSNWDCCIVLPPSDTIGAMYATNIAGINFSDTVAYYNDVLPNASPVAALSSVLAGAGLSTITGGTMGIQNFRPIFSPELPSMWRTTARSATVYATGADLINQGTVYAGQYSRCSVPTGGQASPAPSGGGQMVGVTEVVDLPLREQDMSIITPGNTYYTASAKEGVYTVHRLTGPAQTFTALRGLERWRGSDGSQMFYNTTDPTNYTSQTSSVARFRNDSFNGLSPNFPPGSLGYYSTAFDQNCSWGVIIFRGLHPQMTLTLKTYTCLELVPSVNAPSRQFVTPPIKFEPTAMSAYYALSTEMPSAMPARYNFLGAILPALAAVASRILPVLAPAAGPLLTALGERLRPASKEPIPAAPPTAMRRSRSASVGSRVSRASSRRVSIRTQRKTAKKRR